MFNRTTGGARWALASLAAVAVAALVALGAIYATRVQAAPAAAVFTVANTNNSGPGSLRQAIVEANTTPGPDTIRITAHGTVHLSSTLSITDEVTLLGPGADLFAVDGGGVVRVFTILTARASVADLTVQNGNEDVNGGGGIVATGALTLTNVSLLHNLARIGAGAFVGGPATLIGGRFENNTSQDEGGGLFAIDALNVTGTKFISNTALENGGGGVAAESRTQIYGARFENNHCTAIDPFNCIGGGLAAFGTLIMTDTQFISNTASEDGGGAWALSLAQISGGRFENNRCIRESSCDGGGLAVGEFGGGQLTLIGTQFVGNSAGARGGGLHVKGVARVSGARFEHNRCEGQTCHGGGLDAQATLQLTATEVVSNTSNGLGGGQMWTARSR